MQANAADRPMPDVPPMITNLLPVSQLPAIWRYYLFSAVKLSINQEKDFTVLFE
jgi:hypothetical protein